MSVAFNSLNASHRKAGTTARGCSTTAARGAVSAIELRTVSADDSDIAPDVLFVR
jgi:hypothetical protein